jgi:hypothetical protein
MAGETLLELDLDRRWFLIDSWKAAFIAAVDLVWGKSSSTRIAVPPMSEAWLRQHAADFPKHSDEML